MDPAAPPPPPPPPPKAKSFFSYDQYYDYDMEDALEDDAIPYAQYTHQNAMGYTTSPGRGPHIVGNTSTETYTFAAERSKLLGASMLKTARILFEGGETLGRFDESNLFVSPSGRIRFRHVKRVVAAELAHIIGCYMDILRVLWKLFTIEGRIPVDIQHLLDLIEFHTLDYIQLFDRHASLTPLCLRSPLLTQMYNELKFGLTPTEQASILLQLPYLDTWKQQIDGNYLLKGSLHFRGGRYDDPPQQPWQQPGQQQPGQQQQAHPQSGQQQQAQPQSGQQQPARQQSGRRRPASQQSRQQHPANQQNPGNQSQHQQQGQQQLGHSSHPQAGQSNPQPVQQFSPFEVNVMKAQNLTDYVRNTSTHKMEEARAIVGFQGKIPANPYRTYNGWRRMFQCLAAARYTVIEYEHALYVCLPMFLVQMQVSLFNILKQNGRNLNVLFW